MIIQEYHVGFVRVGPGGTCPRNLKLKVQAQVASGHSGVSRGGRPTRRIRVVRVYVTARPGPAGAARAGRAGRGGMQREVGRPGPILGDDGTRAGHGPGRTGPEEAEVDDDGREVVLALQLVAPLHQLPRYVTRLLPSCFPAPVQARASGGRSPGSFPTVPPRHFSSRVYSPPVCLVFVCVCVLCA